MVAQLVEQRPFKAWVPGSSPGRLTIILLRDAPTTQWLLIVKDVTNMSKICQICGKGQVVGGSITRRGLAKKKGGIGMHVVKNVKRVFRPNIQTVRANVQGTVKRIKVCVACIRSGCVTKA